jgi:hypothetical protein
MRSVAELDAVHRNNLRAKRAGAMTNLLHRQPNALFLADSPMADGSELTISMAEGALCTT